MWSKVFCLRILHKNSVYIYVHLGEERTVRVKWLVQEHSMSEQCTHFSTIAGWRQCPFLYTPR